MLIIGSVLLVLASQSQNGFVILIGSVLVILSLVMLIAEHYLHGHIRFSFRFSRPMHEKEKAIVNEVDTILGREKELKKQEHKLRKELDVIARKASQLEMHELTRRVEKSELVSEEDLKKFLKMVDTMMEKLPDEEINKFILTKEYQTYKKVLQKYNIK